MSTTKAPRVYTAQFWLLCLSLFLFLAGFNLIIPELPTVLRSYDGGQYLGLIISLFAFSAALSRPLSGKLTDRIGRIPIILFGVSISVICGMLYPLITSILGFFVLRVLHGVAAGFAPTATTSYLTDIIPKHRRGEAMGIVGISTSMGMAIGPPLGSLIAMHWGHDVMFFVSAGISLASLLVVLKMKETLVNREKFTLGLLIIKKDEVIEREVIFPSMVMLLSIFSFGLLLTISPDYSEFLGMKNKGIFFTYFLVSSLLVRITSGRVSDRYGRILVLKVGMALQIIAMLVMGIVQTEWAFIGGGVVYGLAAGINSPTVFAWTADLASDAHRGKAMSTLFLALEIGVFFGAIISGYLYNNNTDMFRITFITGACFSLMAFIFLFTFKPSRYI
jgi:multidrug resistance protein